MSTRVWDEITHGAHDFYRLLVPELPQRIPITWRTFPYTLAFFVPLIFMAYLSRRPNTRLIRLLLLPTVLMMSLRSCYGYMWMGPKMNVYNWGEGLCCLVCIAKALDYASVEDGRFKIGEQVPGEDETPVSSEKEDDPQASVRPANGHAPPASAARPGASVLPRGILDGLELFFAFRGIGWDFGRGVHIPRERKPLGSRRAFLVATADSLGRHFVALDALESTLKLVPGVGTPRGGSIFFAALPPVPRYAVSTALHIASGSCIIAGFQMCYDLATLIGVGLLGHDLSSWPPVMDNPWIATSLNEFWAKRWHQLLRQTFLALGGMPGRLIGGRIGMVLGAFLASGLYHECASIAMGREWDNRVVAFFAVQGVFVIMERVWKMVTGKRVGGWPGRVWVYFVIMVLGQPMIDAWHRRGLAGGMVIPPAISPTRRLLFPLLRHLTGYELNDNQF